MPKLDIGFSWAVCHAGYEVVAPKRPKAKNKTQPRTKRFAPVDPAETLLGQNHEDIAASPRIRPIGEVSMHEPLKVESVFLIFAKLAEPREGRSFEDRCCGFARNFGLLGAWPQYQDAEPLALWRHEVVEMQKHIEQARLHRPALAGYRIPPIEGALVPSGRGQVSLQLRPTSFLAGIKLQFAQHVASDREIRACRFCNDWFEVGPGTGSRADATFCSRRHKEKFFNRGKRGEIK